MAVTVAGPARGLPLGPGEHISLSTAADCALTCSWEEKMGGKRKQQRGGGGRGMWSKPGKWIHMFGGLCEQIG